MIVYTCDTDAILSAQQLLRCEDFWWITYTCRKKVFCFTEETTNTLFFIILFFTDARAVSDNGLVYTSHLYLNKLAVNLVAISLYRFHIRTSYLTCDRVWCTEQWSRAAQHHVTVTGDLQLEICCRSFSAHVHLNISK